jgi:hypothetical protein
MSNRDDGRIGDGIDGDVAGCDHRQEHDGRRRIASDPPELWYCARCGDRVPDSIASEDALFSSEEMAEIMRWVAWITPSVAWRVRVVE